MKRSRPPYSRRDTRRQSPIGGESGRQAPPFFRAALLGAIALSAAGCSQVGSIQGTDSLYTGSIQTSVTDGVAPSDWETMRRAVAGIAPGDTDLTRPWSNPETGSYGSVTVATSEQRAGGICRPFSTTVSDLRGVRRYRGEACQPVGGAWQLSDIRADDSKLL
ncbi:MAG: hypothetical protein KDJ88_04175 [Bauldia sp.]|nr:hypothetical protein [Bauldia sp.]